MKKQTRRNFSSAFKAKVALEALKNQYTLAEPAKKFEVIPVMISKWKSDFFENLSATFERSETNDTKEEESEKLYAVIGQLKVENEFKKTARNWASRFKGTACTAPYFKNIYPQAM